MKFPSEISSNDCKQAWGRNLREKISPHEDRRNGHNPFRRSCRIAATLHNADKFQTSVFQIYGISCSQQRNGVFPMTIRKNTLKYLLDAVMLLLLVLMYDKMAVSMAFHEIGGLFLIGLFTIQLLFNGKWIAAVTQRLFSRKTPAKIRLGYCVDALA
jgi:hypothetical protein